MEQQPSEHRSGSRKMMIYGLYILLIIGGIYLVVYHGPHLYTLLPLIFFLLCPLMHLFHGHHHGSVKDKESKDNQKPKCH